MNIKNSERSIIARLDFEELSTDIEWFHPFSTTDLADGIKLMTGPDYVGPAKALDDTDTLTGTALLLKRQSRDTWIKIILREEALSLRFGYVNKKLLRDRLASQLTKLDGRAIFDQRRFRIRLDLLYRGGAIHADDSLVQHHLGLFYPDNLTFTNQPGL